MNPVQAWKSLNPPQRRAGIAGWLGWMFDGLDMHLYTLVAKPYVAALLGLAVTSQEVDQKGAIIQAAFLAGWAFGGGVFGVIGDRLGRSRTLVLTILCYSIFCGLSAFAQNWWQLMICRFLSALGIGGEWAVGAALLSESLPKKWGPWIAGVLQTAVNVGILLACLAGFLMKDLDPRWIFLVGVVPALITLWIRRAVPETEEWSSAQQGPHSRSRIRDLFAPGQSGVTWRVLLICAAGLTAHWAFMFWQQSFIRQHEAIRNLDPSEKNTAVAVALTIIVGSSILGNFVAAFLAVRMGYARAMAVMAAIYGLAMASCFATSWSYSATLLWFAVIGVCQGLFGLFTMCLPPLFPTLLRTTGAGFCYNTGRLVAAAGTIFFGLFNTVGTPGGALLFASILFIPTTFLSLWLPKPKAEPA
ncbi:MAG TPA: MFS transporter [Verrucomicrobiales bacterium]|jgi:predicted MFS family arabinose efflux permease|nr:MFS transporter [Verrucomicrobiales bacterium]